MVITHMLRMGNLLQLIRITAQIWVEIMSSVQNFCSCYLDVTLAGRPVVEPQKMSVYSG